jgi:predicted restriction endonuclease
VAAASVVQRAEVAGLRCLVCGAATRIDPAHLVPRSLGGCDEADCVVPLCRTHHRAYDQGASTWSRTSSRSGGARSPTPSATSGS